VTIVDGRMNPTLGAMREQKGSGRKRGSIAFMVLCVLSGHPVNTVAGTYVRKKTPGGGGGPPVAAAWTMLRRRTPGALRARPPQKKFC